MSTLDFYNENAGAYAESTLSVNMAHEYECFLRYLPKGGKILDLGCGSGRDSIAFLEQGYDVIPLDGSAELGKIAEKNIGRPVVLCRFQDLDFHQEFDGVWACASLLHVPEREMKDVLCRVADSLKTGGILYASYKYGKGEREDNGKHYTDYTEADMERLFADTGLSVINVHITGDALNTGRDIRWVNVIAMK